MKGTVVRIIHFSDFHLSKTTESDSENLVASLIASLKTIKADRAIDFVVFTGDAIDRGGYSYTDINEAFSCFEQKVIDPLMKVLELPKNRFLLTPGNHDLDFAADDMTKECELDKKLKTESDIDKYVKETDINDYAKRLFAFKSFEQHLYSDMRDAYIQTNFQSNFLYDINGVKLCITSLNSSWRCNALKLEGDRNRIVVGAFQVVRSMKCLNDSHLKIAIAHHHPTFLLEDEQVGMNDIISRNYHLFLCGHTHRTEAATFRKMGGNRCMEITSSGTMAYNQYTDNSKNKNSFQLIDITGEGKIYNTPYTLENYVNFTPGVSDSDTIEDLQQNLAGITVAHPLLHGELVLVIKRQPMYTHIKYQPQSMNPNKGSQFVVTNIPSLATLVNHAFAEVEMIFKNDNDFPLENCILTLELLNPYDTDEVRNSNIVSGIFPRINSNVHTSNNRAEARISTINPHDHDSLGFFYVHCRHKDPTAKFHWKISTKTGAIEGETEIPFTPIIKTSKVEYTNCFTGEAYEDYVE